MHGSPSVDTAAPVTFDAVQHAVQGRPPLHRQSPVTHHLRSTSRVEGELFEDGKEMVKFTSMLGSNMSFWFTICWILIGASIFWHQEAQCPAGAGGTTQARGAVGTSVGDAAAGRNATGFAEPLALAGRNATDVPCVWRQSEQNNWIDALYWAVVTLMVSNLFKWYVVR